MDLFRQPRNNQQATLKLSGHEMPYRPSMCLDLNFVSLGPHACALFVWLESVHLPEKHATNKRENELPLLVYDPKVCGPEFAFVGARMRAPMLNLRSVYIPEEACQTRVENSHHLLIYDPRVECRQCGLKESGVGSDQIDGRQENQSILEALLGSSAGPTVISRINRLSCHSSVRSDPTRSSLNPRCLNLFIGYSKPLGNGESFSRVSSRVPRKVDTPKPRRRARIACPDEIEIRGTELTPTIEEYRTLINRTAITRDIVEPNIYTTRPMLVSRLLGVQTTRLNAELAYSGSTEIAIEKILLFIQSRVHRVQGDILRKDLFHVFLLLIFGTLLFPHSRDLVDATLAGVILQVVGGREYEVALVLRPFGPSTAL
ncbi:hypothetical protein CRG98_040788 [Punica granatum]|uniref:DUF7745 domain-containing protein n=1 Tax=Punica granatum TaxID=22663 RepID=A0A2I0I482_PUNGR|nr:hypothetical protein CRG98_040788 [Punica granatum]